jgi:cobalamin biosynthesis Mg chelatase CobN
VGRDTSRQARAETLAKAASSGADTVKAHTERAAHTAHAATATGIRTLQEAVHGSGSLAAAADQVRQKAGPARDTVTDAVQQIAEQARHTSGTLTARAGHQRHGDVRRWPVRALVAGLSALGAGALIWWLARSPEDGAPTVLPVQTVPPA